MLKNLANSVASSLRGSPAKDLPPTHSSGGRADTYVIFGQDLEKAGIPADLSDCARCDRPCPIDETDATGAGTISESGQIWDGKSYEEYVLDRYGDLGELPKGFDCDWDSELAGSGQPARGRVVVISTGKSNWVRDHTDEKDSFAHHLDRYLRKNPPEGNGKGPKRTVDFNTKPPLDQFIAPTAPIANVKLPPPSFYSSSLISQADDPEDQTILVFPDWKVVNEVENTSEGAGVIYNDVLKGGIGKAGRGDLSAEEKDGLGRKRSWVMPYRAVVLLCSHKNRDKRCHIAAPLLRSALTTCLSKYGVNVDETGTSLCGLEGPPLEELSGDESSREAEVQKRIESIEGINGGDGGEVGIFNINHLGGHRYAGVMIILFPSGAYLSYGRLTPQEIPRVVEDTIMRGKIVPGLLRAAAGVDRAGAPSKSLLGW